MTNVSTMMNATGASASGLSKSTAVDAIGPQSQNATKHSRAESVSHGEDLRNGPSKKRKTTPKDLAASKSWKTTASRQRRASGKTVTVPRPLARTWAELSEEDERLITLRDAGRTWPDIRKEWEVMTGETVGSSTLPNRYSRLKTNLTVINEEDCARMFESLSEVETAFQREKWNLVANSVVAKGGTEYKGEALLRQYRKMMTEHGTVPPPGINSPDFDGGDHED